MNRVELIGRMTSDANLSYVGEKQTAKATFSLAVNDGYGENSKAYFIPIVIFGKSAENLATYTSKGSKIAVLGKITTRTYENNQGTKKYITEVVADLSGGVEFLDSRNNSDLNRNFGEYIIPVNNGDSPF
ncbi:single-stranded DNA-binding protein [Clostridium sp.]|uniref:single-stranded DNA-binding protein n=1 Tax=Clostridium sp. TaxID=1506 RepID=UPI0026228BCD|nr:single-stranded DNA-binding protein [Clostridium sp.]